MNSATRTPPQHGERRCYLRGCRRPECSAANYRYMSRYRLDRERGKQRYVDATPTADHVRVLLDAGWNLRQIGDAAGCAHRVIADLAHRRQTTVKPSTADGVLAISPYPVPEPAQYVDATGTMRRLQALAAIGYTNRQLAATIGIWPATVGRILHGELTQVLAATARNTTAAYRDLSRRPGPSQRTRSRARQEGWHGPMAWDDIDDPNALPEVDTNPRRSPIELQPCGTTAAYRRHLRNQEPIDAACQLANRLHLADRKRARAAA